MDKRGKMSEASRKPRIIILGGGIAGLACEYELKEAGLDPLLLDKHQNPGGHARSYEFGGCTFDEGPHISFTKDPKVQDEIWNESDIEISDPRISNYWKGHWIPHPVQTHLYALPRSVRLRLLVSFIFRRRRKNVENYEDWNHKTFGKFFSEEFVRKYTSKYWQKDLKDLTTDWVSDRIYSPSLAEVFFSSFRLTMKLGAEREQHYITKFHYPLKGGFQAFFSKYGLASNGVSGCEISAINLRDKTVSTTASEVISFEHLFSSIPLPKFMEMVTDEDASEAKKSAAKLECTSVVLVDLIYASPPLIDAMWTYIYDEKFLSTRVHFPYRFSPNNAPSDRFSVQVEIYDRDAQMYGEQELILRIQGEMIEMGIFDTGPIYSQSTLIEFANVLFTKDRETSVQSVKDYLESKSVSLIGRYGRWDYSWSDQAFMSGYESATRYSEGMGTD